MEAIDLGKASMSVGRERVPLLDEELEVVVHVDFELTNALSREGMRDGLPLSSVLYSVSGVEETSLNGNEGIVKFSAQN